MTKIDLAKLGKPMQKANHLCPGKGLCGAGPGEVLRALLEGIDIAAWPSKTLRPIVEREWNRLGRKFYGKGGLK